MWMHWDSIPIGGEFYIAGTKFEKMAETYGSSAQCPVYIPTLFLRYGGYVNVA